jgi:MoaA/NifB/PqqE/SkfB family radical SAM enzyme
MRILPLSHYLPTARAVIRNTLSREAVFPFYASFKLTCRCHFACPFCNVRNDKSPDLSTSDIKRILDNLSHSSVLMTSFEGGEPLLREDIGELLEYARYTCKFYLLFTTSMKNLLDYPMVSYAPFIDFLHISIDEGHNNLELFDRLKEIATLNTQVSVQTVVTSETLDALENKVKRCREAGCRIVVIPATHMDKTEDFFPDIGRLKRIIVDLKKRFPFTIHTPIGYFSAFEKGKCSSASVIIAPDGRLYYPCHILGSKGPDLRSVDLNSWLTSKEAHQFRTTMSTCSRKCGWYQYYSIDSYTSIFSIFEALGPLFFRRRKS